MAFYRSLMLLVAVLVAAGATSARAATPEQVETAIKRAKAYIYSEHGKGPGPHWELLAARKGVSYGTKEGQWGGRTAIAVYALLAAGESPQEPRIADAIKWLMKADIIGIYALGMRAQIWGFLPPSPEVKAAIKKDGTLLSQGLGDKGEGKGFYAYLVNADSFHHSTAQYGVLGMWACEKAGLEVPQGYWKEVDAAWRRTQFDDGSWPYWLPKEGAKGTASMTTAGIATLFITQDYLYAMRGVTCKGNIADENIEKAMAWINKNLKKNEDAYTWYGVERIGVASGYKYFGEINWYEMGAEHFIKTQKVEGDTGKWNEKHGGEDLPGTCFGLIFLTRGRAPVVMNKLDYSGGNASADAKKNEPHWNQRPRDANNITNWIGDEIERSLNWQIVNLQAPVHELHDAPILYIAGDEPVKFTDDEKKKIRQYIEEGGLVLGNADCGNKAFADSFRKFGSELFPAYEFRELPDNHAIHTLQQFQRQPKHKSLSVLGLSNGSRELMILFPEADPARAWQTKQIGGKEELFQAAANVFLYSVDKQNLRNKGETYMVTPDQKISTDRTIKLARLEYVGNWDPEPAGWRRLAAVMRNDHKVALNVTTAKLGEGKIGDAKVAHITGTTKFTLDEKQREELKKFVSGGGTLVIDATGGATDFLQSMEQQIGIMFPTEAKQLDQVLPASHAIYTLPSNKIDDVNYRTFARRQLMGDARAGRIRGIMLNGRPAILLSREDMSTGLVGQPVDGVLGYDPKTATKLMTNILLNAVYGAKDAAAKAEG